MIDNDFLDFAAMAGLSQLEILYVERVLKFAFNDRLPYPKQSRLARMMGCSLRTVSEVSRSLTKHQMQHLTPRFGPKGKIACYIDVRPCVAAVKGFAEWYRKTILTMEQKDRYSPGSLLLIKDHQIKPLNEGRGGSRAPKLKVVQFKKTAAGE